MPCSTPSADDHRRRDQRQAELAGALAPDVAQAAHVDEPDGDGEDDRPEDAARQVLQRAGEEEEHERHDAGGREVRHLAAPAGPTRPSPSASGCR